MATDEHLATTFATLARELQFNPLYLREILRLRNQGYNNSEIAEMLGISRTTVTSYVHKLRQKQTDEDFAKLILLGLALFAGAKVLEEISKEVRK